MDYRQAVEQAQELFDSVANTKRLADVIIAAYETGKAEREPPTPDAQGYLHVTEACYAVLQADRRRMDRLDEWLIHEGLDNWKIDDCSVKMGLGSFEGHRSIREAIDHLELKVL